MQQTDARRLLDAAQSEAAYQDNIVQLAEAYGWWSYHVRDSRGSNAGFPDLMLVRGVDLRFLEVKAQKGRVRPEQEMVIGALRHVERVHADIVRPSDWPRLEQALRR